METDAVIAGNYRYKLTRTWEEGPRVAFVMLNPSTADETEDDPTIRRCVGFARDWGYTGLVVVNLFAFRTKDPPVLLTVPQPVGALNPFFWREVRDDPTVNQIIAAWGAAPLAQRVVPLFQAVMQETGRMVQCLGETEHGHPKHPLYLAKTTKRREYALC